MRIQFKIFKTYVQTANCAIIQIIDNLPVVNKYQLKFWDWVSRYYFTSIGEVMRASVPSNLILQSETVLTLNNDKEIEMGDLNDSEYLVVEALNINKQLSVKDVSEILEKGYSCILTMVSIEKTIF